MIDATTYFERMSARAAALYSIAMLVVVAALDIEIGRELTLSPLYLIPVMLITWKCSATAGIAMSLGAYALLAGITLLDDGITELGYVLWEGSLRLGTALLFIIALSQLKDSLAREKQLARNDSLTGLANRGSFYEIVNLEMLRCRRYGGAISIAFIDLDNFKALNDRSGHGVGDEALRVVAQIMRKQLRANDVPARLGGDEFAIMFAGMAARGASQAMQILQSRLLSAMRERDWSITFSIGLATFTTVPDSVDEMIKRADSLMYEIKRGGSGGINERVLA